VRRLEERIAQTPDFTDGAKWLQRIQETLSLCESDAAALRTRAMMQAHR
jgi:hypothetical protein